MGAEAGSRKRAAGWGGGSAGGCWGRENMLQLPCLLGIRDLLTHLEPLVHPKYTPAKEVTTETTVGSGSLSHLQPPGKVQLFRDCSQSPSDQQSTIRGKGRPLGGEGRSWGDPASLFADLPMVDQMAENSINGS